MTTDSNRYDELWRDAYGQMQCVGPVHRHVRRLLRELLADIEYGSALEVGCGAGHNFELLREGGRSVELSGADVSVEALDRAAQAWPHADLHQLDIEAGALERTWDLLLCSLVLEHVGDDVAALRNMRAMAGRHLLVATIAGDMARYLPWEERVGHVRNYVPGELEEKLAAAGFVVERTIHWGYPFYSPLGRLLQRRMRPSPEFGAGTRLAAWLLFGLYRLNSRHRGDLLLVRAGVR